MQWIFLLIGVIFPTFLSAADFVPSRERPPRPTREFRAAWVATIYNIDWPSSSGLSGARQRQEAIAILDKLVELKMNAVILQVRPQCDALYQSSLEPWTPSLTGTMGRSPGYDPLAFWISEAHARGIELHAWFNPFRALASQGIKASPDHITRTNPALTRKYGTMVWCDPSLPEVRSKALAVILDVVKRYPIDGVHLDDYFYPYPSAGLRFPDGKSPAQRRDVVDRFVRDLYSAVKKQKPWVRVGISPFGIWRPGVPAGIEAGIDSYEQLAGDSRKWLAKGWVDYLAPQLYWRDRPAKQSYSTLLGWWRGQGSRPVWPGIASARVHSSEDPGRPASEITSQIDISRRIGDNWHGHIHWSVKSLMKNQGGVATSLRKSYTQPTLPPPMPWLSKSSPDPVRLSATSRADGVTVSWKADSQTNRIAIQAKIAGNWRTVAVVPASRNSLRIAATESIAVTAVNAYGNLSDPKVLTIRR